ncbi:MAG: hypothetical protein ACRD1O_01650 [Terriglobia bacterium]
MPLDKRAMTGKRLAANRSAALQSTGPKSEDGKRRSAFNSFQHGLFSTQDSTLRQAMSRAGYDPEAFDALHQDLLRDWQPEGAQQSLLVADLTRLYWLKALHQRAHLEWNARQGERFRLEQKAARNAAERNRPSILDFSHTIGWRYLDPDEIKFDGVFQCLGRLEAKAERADWEEESAEEIFRALYGDKLNQAGRAMKDLFQQGREQKAKADSELAQQLKALINEERQSAREEQRLWEEQRQLEQSLPLDHDDPALQPLSVNWQESLEREARLDRQINAKIRLLIRLQAPPRSKKTENGPAPVGDQEGRSFNSAAPPEPGEQTSAGIAHQSFEVQKLGGSCQENIQTEQTKPSKPLESTNPISQGSGAWSVAALQTPVRVLSNSGGESPHGDVRLA